MSGISMETESIIRKDILGMHKICIVCRRVNWIVHEECDGCGADLSELPAFEIKRQKHGRLM